MVEDIKIVVLKESLLGIIFMNYFGVFSKSIMIFLVYVLYKENLDRERLVYVLFDIQLDIIFILDKILKVFGFEGKFVKFMFFIMYVENKVVDSCKIGGFFVCGFNSEYRILLLEMYIREIMFVNRFYILILEIVRRWFYLEVIVDEFLFFVDCEVGLFIGYNCVKVLMFRDVIVLFVDGFYG